MISDGDVIVRIESLPKNKGNPIAVGENIKGRKGIPHGQYTLQKRKVFEYELWRNGTAIYSSTPKTDRVAKKIWIGLHGNAESAKRGRGPVQFPGRIPKPDAGAAPLDGDGTADQHGISAALGH